MEMWISLRTWWMDNLEFEGTKKYRVLFDYYNYNLCSMSILLGSLEERVFFLFLSSFECELLGRSGSEIFFNQLALSLLLLISPPPLYFRVCPSSVLFFLVVS